MLGIIYQQLQFLKKSYQPKASFIGQKIKPENKEEKFKSLQKLFSRRKSDKNTGRTIVRT